ncbi:alpha-amylase [Friedmanniella luteola]|uniref:Alpha-amylase n=1 Tax=Friedmanniella luteola TaxID=546871 RepID=A0A1H1MML0_9ACTN|nr:alpha-amylase family protein [Friedmanniella luteola]SDR87189.1 alpha-amylase [Friedmanniella luteola]
MDSPRSRGRTRPFLRRTAALAAAALAASLALAVPTADGAVARGRSTQEPGVTVSLWEWNWPSIARECTDVLGPAGYDGVQVAPPQNSLKRTALGNGSDTVLHPWWEVYQAVSYDLTSRMGTEAQFKKMVKACRKAGVKVYVDAVINHTTGQGSTSYGGVDYQPYTYAGTYDKGDFHAPSGECPSSDGGIQDFNAKAQVWNCNLVGLEDLRTGTDDVQAELAGYLNKLIRYGVSGFRVDAAKHMPQRDLDAIYARLNRTADGVRPYWVLEVLPGGPGVLRPEAYLRSGDVLGVDGARQMQQAFKSYTGTGNVGSLSSLEVFGPEAGLTPGAKTLSFVTNHDSERNRNDYLSSQDGPTFILANQWLLAQGYGSPQVYSSFTWEQADASPPARPDGRVTDTVCGQGWTCDHRNPGIVAMVGWHDYVGKAKRANFWSDDANVVAFSKGNRGWVALNNGAAAKQVRVQTGLPGGRYCDVVGGAPSAGACTGTVVTVGSTGFATVTVPAKGVVAITRASRR